VRCVIFSGHGERGRKGVLIKGTDGPLKCLNADTYFNLAHILHRWSWMFDKGLGRHGQTILDKEIRDHCVRKWVDDRDVHSAFDISGNFAPSDIP